MQPAWFLAGQVLNCFSEKIRLDISCEPSARQRIHMKYQALFPYKDKSKKIRNCLHTCDGPNFQIRRFIKFDQEF